MASTEMLGHANGAKCTVLIASFNTAHTSHGRNGNATPHQGAGCHHASQMLTGPWQLRARMLPLRLPTHRPAWERLPLQQEERAP